MQEISSEHHHHSRSRAPENVRADQGTHTTMFKCGFARRQQPDIRADAPRLAREAFLQDRSAANAAGRRARLSELNGYNSFNPVSGAFDPKGIRKAMEGLPGAHSYDAGFVSGARATGMHPQMHTIGGPDDPGEQWRYPSLNGPTPLVAFRPYEGSRLLPAVAKDGANALAQSHYRFFRPVPTGEKHDARQVTLVREGGGPSHPTAAGGGNGQPRTNNSGVIGTFRYMDRLPSHGIEDQFSKSGYGKDAHEYPDFNVERTAGAPLDPNSHFSSSSQPEQEPYFGLAETRQPGLYTPRKQAERLQAMAAQQQASYEDYMYQVQQQQQQTLGGGQPLPSSRSMREGGTYSARAAIETGLVSSRGAAAGSSSSRQFNAPSQGSAPLTQRASARALPPTAAAPQGSARGMGNTTARGATLPRSTSNTARVEAAARSARESDIAAVRAL